jgi:hypothetical protein
LIETVGVDEHGQPIGPSIEPLQLGNLSFPLNVQIRLFQPPCRHKITVTTTLSRGGTVAENLILNICEETSGELVIDPYEQPVIGSLEIAAPNSVNAGDTVTVTCHVSQLDAPDGSRYLLSATLTEQNGYDISGVIDENAPLSGSFTDPYPVSLSSEETRIFTCTVSDERVLSQTASRSITRVLPTPTPRFTDNGDGTVTDNESGLIWLKDTKCAAFGAPLNWNDAMNASKFLSNGICGLSDGSNAGDWRLPKVSEVEGLIDYSESNPALPNGHPFLNVVSDFYWTSSEDVSDTTSAWRVYMKDGMLSVDNKAAPIFPVYVWPVR